jgi:hypothetical protein
MAKTPKKVTPRLSKDVREVIREMSKAPFGTAGKVTKFPQLTTAEAEELKARQKKVAPLQIKREGKELNAKQLDSIAKRISKDRGISFNQAKEMLWKELSKSPKSTPVNQPTVLSKAIPTREQLESTGYRAVKYQGKTIYLSPAQVKQIASDLGIKVDLKGGQTNLFGESTRGSYEKITGVSPEARAVIDRKAAAEAERLRTEAMRDWQAQSKASATNPMVRPPAEQLKAVSAASPKAEAYAERLYKKAFQQLTPKERKAINMIIEEEARRAQKATSSKVGQGVKPDSYRPPVLKGGALGGVLGFGGGGLIDQIK